jgi:hypothetical protein
MYQAAAMQHSCTCCAYTGGSFPLHFEVLAPIDYELLVATSYAGLHLTADRLDTKWMEGFSGYHVHNAFGVEANVDQELQPGIMISKPVSGWWGSETIL